MYPLTGAVNPLTGADHTTNRAAYRPGASLVALNPITMGTVAGDTEIVAAAGGEAAAAARGAKSAEAARGVAGPGETVVAVRAERPLRR